MKKSICAVAIVLLPWFGFAQFSGTVSDASSNEKVAGAIVTVKNSFLISVTNADGKFSLSDLKETSGKLQIMHLGYESKIVDVEMPFENLEIKLERKTYLTEEATVTATRASDNSPTAFTNIDKKQIEEKNLGQDVPFLLSTTPSVVVTSDAGNGVGYTGIRIRGSDATRINVTINGIPVNDAESHGMYWVDLPDFASSIENIQIQRGIGTSTNGAGAFGGSVNIQSHALSSEAFGSINSSYGSFNTWKNSVNFGTGLLKNHFALEGRLSKITSDGYIDRSTSDLKSFYLGGGYYGTKSSLHAIIFSGREKTYQAWYGIPQDSLKTNRTYNPAGQYYDVNGKILYYENQTDNYQQDYYQLHWNYAASPAVNVNAALHYTKGQGYYEEYKPFQFPVDYGLSNSVISDSVALTNGIDLIRQLWLDNDFYGATFSVNYDKSTLRLTAGGAANTYEGRHYNQVIWSQYYIGSSYPAIYDDNHATKDDLNVFTKALYSITPKFHLYGDIQYRKISYSFVGFKDDLSFGQNQVALNFFNPKGGITYDLNSKHKVYASAAVGHKEPVRDDYVDSPPYAYPKPEKMLDIEAGYKFSGRIVQVGINLYDMEYKDQLILTGKLNDVGEYIRINVAESYRRGVEFEASVYILKNLSMSANATVSENKIKTFDEYIDNYDDYSQLLAVHENTNIAFSPSLTSAAVLSWKFLKHFSLESAARYVGEQFLDNTSNTNRMLNDYLTNDFFLSYHVSTKNIKDIGLKVAVYNAFNELYESSGWTYPYYYGGTLYTMNGFYPQAGTNWMAGISLKF